MKKIMVLLSVIIVFGLSACMSPSDLEINEIPDTTLSMITLESNANIGLVVRANGQVDSVIDFNDEGKSALEGIDLTNRSLEEVLDLLIPRLRLNETNPIKISTDSQDAALSTFFTERTTTHVESIIKDTLPPTVIDRSEAVSSTSSTIQRLDERFPVTTAGVNEPTLDTPSEPSTPTASTDLQSKLEDVLASSFIQNAPDDDIDPNRVRIILVFRRNVDESIIERTQGNVLRRYQNMPAVTLIVPLQAIRGLVNNPNVERIEYDTKVSVSELSEWSLDAVQVPQVWNNGYSGRNIRIGVIDTGIAAHPDLQIAGGASFVSYTQSYNDDNGHGTHVAGIIGALSNGFGIIGIAYNASLYSIKVLDSNGSGYLSDVVAGIDYAIQQNLDIINLSLGTTTDSLTLKTIVDKAYQNGILVVAAAGNIGTSDGSLDNITYPARYSSVIAVGAVDSRLRRASFSSTGPTLELVAPGVSILSTHLGGQYVRLSGTSMAAPFVTGYLALMMEAFPTMSAPELRTLLQETARDLGVSGWDPEYGQGIIQAFDAPNIMPPAEEPAVEEPGDEPVAPTPPQEDSDQNDTTTPDEPVTDEPVTEDPEAEEPSTDDPVTEPNPSPRPPVNRPPQSQPTAPVTPPPSNNFNGRLASSVTVNKTDFRSDEVVEIKIAVRDQNQIGIQNAQVQLTITPPQAGRIRPFTVNLTTAVDGQLTYRFTLPFNPNQGEYRVIVSIEYQGVTDQVGTTFNARR